MEAEMDGQLGPGGGRAVHREREQSGAAVLLWTSRAAFRCHHLIKHAAWEKMLVLPVL